MENRRCLEYTCPSHGGWGMVRIGMLIPESHQLFVCPSACGRHGALGAIKQGLKNRLSYLYLEESDVISGYDDAIYDAVDELLRRLYERPKVLIVFVSCLDDLIGTDGDAVIDELSVRYPDVKFRMGHMNPIQSDSDEPPLVSIWKNVYSLMERDAEECIPAVNMLGNYVPIDEDGEFHELMALLGMKICHVGNCETYQELKEMGNSCLNLLVTPPVEKVARQLKREQGMDYIFAPVKYDFEEIKEEYQTIFDKFSEMGVISEVAMVGGDTTDAMDHFRVRAEQIISAAENKARKAIEDAREAVGERSLYVDYSAFVDPFRVAAFFHKEGFPIKRVYAKDIDENQEEYRYLVEQTDVEIVHIKGHDIVNKWKESDEGIAIGLEAAYVSGAKHVVSVFQDEKMFGFHGVCLLMEKLKKSVEEEVDLENVINQAGLVV